ncbi:putative amidophosphoribosyltransferase [Deinococcus metalli]|uniref:Putative amidophosphoribosyltransferase n=1 Tax=Deinococcus metalli TaxID=1141878 RepID=A0A7W8KFK0_9DEIO|nr:zinc ribbon domain-containing protein [Deinococcus metalli]MBB5376096.1 putative amidophosphoribosyltransferase [Deinococcus metalli]GHF40824.1 hypothetical protein GCM10017781_16870 [Deinococcus metalli]
MSDGPRQWSRRFALRHDADYALCPRCWRAVPARLGEHYCVNDGARLLSACPACRRPIASPYARYCAGCGQAYGEGPPAPDAAPPPGTAP